MSEFHYAMHEILMHAKSARWRSAAGSLRLVVEIWERSEDIWHGLGVCLEEAGESVAAGHAYRRALAIERNHRPAATDLTALQQRLHWEGWSAEAAEPTEAALRFGLSQHVLSTEAPAEGRDRQLRRMALERFGLSVDEPLPERPMAPFQDFLVRHHLGLAMEHDLAERWGEAILRYRRALGLGIGDPVAKKLASDGLESALRRLRAAWPPTGASMQDRRGRSAAAGRTLLLLPGHAEARAAVEGEAADASRRAEDLVRQASEAESARRLEAAMAAYRRAAAISPEHPSARREWRRLRQYLHSAASGETVVDGVGRLSFSWDGQIRRLRHRDRATSGTALLCFQPQQLLLDDDDDEFSSHGLYWEMRTIGRLLLARGLDLDIVHLRAPLPAPMAPYRVAVALHDDLHRHAAHFDATTVKIAVLTGSNPEVQNRREIERIEAMRVRRGAACSPRRQIPHVDAELAAYRLADHLFLLGNDVTRATYPTDLQSKITLGRPTAAWPCYIKTPATFVPPEREFLWLGSPGAVLKGLDLLLEIFSEHQQWVLNVVGPVNNEPEFEELYRKALYNHQRIRTFGFRRPATDTIREIVDRCFCVVIPSAAEGMSTSVLTCLQIGLYPLISRENGVDIPAGLGTVLDDCSFDSIRTALATVYSMPAQTLAQQIEALQRDAVDRFSRYNFTERMEANLNYWLSRC
jgi:tetratricopeptide (TPR) repeat protein